MNDLLNNNTKSKNITELFTMFSKIMLQFRLEK